jgi:Domain of unknown function (DUF3597)
MSIFGSIVSAIFGSKPAEAKPPAGSPASSGASSGPSTAASVDSPASPKPMTLAEVEAMIANIAASQSAKYNWKVSIVDLMKLLKLDNSLAARKELAQELGYKDELNGSAEMNIWLHKQVMTRLAESGGVVPDSLKKH